VLGLTPPVAVDGHLESWLEERANMTHLIRQHLSRAKTTSRSRLTNIAVKGNSQSAPWFI
jgi:hypothetical protein